MPLRLRLTLLSAAVLAIGSSVVLGLSWWLLARHLARTLPEPLAAAVTGQLAGQYALALLGGVLIASGAGWLVAGHALAPLRRIAATARRVTTERLGERIGLAGPPDEIHQLAGTVDDMLDRLESAVDRQRRFVANAGHELRTPLTVIRTEADVTLSDPAASVEDLRAMGRITLEALDRTEELLDGLLVLATSEHGRHRDDPVDLAAVTRRAVDGLRADAAAVGVDFEVAVAPATVCGDAALLERLVENLVENAIRHSPGRPATVRVATGPAHAVVEVANGGPVIPADLAARLAEPFQRLDRRRAARGAGLGLSIVRAIAEAHGGSLVLEAPATGGLRARVTLPLEAPAIGAGRLALPVTPA